MGKYNFDLDLVSNNSLNYIQKRIKPESKILEFGCANGRLTKYLKEELNCEITIVEIDEEAGNEAAQFANNAILGKEGNLDNDDWKSKLGNNLYDYIVFADVLEHLRDPKAILKYCKKLLKPNGSILASVPNLANNSVIAYLWDNRFDYHSTGLLDNTHIHFFSLDSFRKMVDEIHCEMIYETATYSGIGKNEIPVQFNTLPNELRKLLAERHLGDVYQYIFQFKNREEEEALEKESYFIDTTNRYYQTELYYEVNNMFHPDSSLQMPLKLGKQILKGNVNGVSTNCIRFDPVNASAILNIVEVKINDDIFDLSKIKSNADYYEDGLFIFFNDDPNILISHEKIENFEIEYELIDYDFPNNKSYSKLLNLIQDKINQKLNFEIKIKNYEEQKEEMQKAIQIYEQQRCEMQNAINIYEQQRNEMQNAINDYEGQRDALTDQVLNLEESHKEKDSIITLLNEQVQLLQMELSKKFSTRLINKIKKIVK